MNRATLGVLLLSLATLLRAQNAPIPELALDVNAQTDAVVSNGWPLLIRAAVVSADGQPVKIGVNGGAWTQALHLSISDANGLAQTWSTHPVSTASTTLSLSGTTTAEAVWLVAPADSANIAPGLYNLTVTLDTTANAAAGTWSGSVSANGSTVQLQAEPATLSPDVEASKYLAFSAYSQLLGDTASARTALDTLIGHQPDILWGYTEKADLLTSLGDYAGAMDLAQQALAKFNAQDPNPEEPPSIIMHQIGNLGLKLANQQAAGTGAVVTSVAPGSTVTLLAPDSIAVGYGARLATAPMNNSGTLDTTLGGTTVSIKDAKGQSVLAPLFYVSPGQVNYSVPASVALGTATVTVKAGDGTTSAGLVSIVPVEPGLFTINADGLIAGNILRFPSGGGDPAYEPLFTLDGAGNVQARPIDLSTGQVYLVLYGTGIRGASTGQVSVSIGGVAGSVAYAGAQGTDVGLDQVNVLVPASLAGQGDVPLALTAAGRRSNTARITLK
jgi:uncharacterized protein (TIGR03437 family)